MRHGWNTGSDIPLTRDSNHILYTSEYWNTRALEARTKCYCCLFLHESIQSIFFSRSMEKYCKKLRTKHSSYPAPFSQCDKTLPECKTVLTTEITNVNSTLGHRHVYVQVCHPFPGGGGVLIIIFLKGLRSQGSQVSKINFSN